MTKRSALEMASASGRPLSATTVALLFNADKGGAWQNPNEADLDQPQKPAYDGRQCHCSAGAYLAGNKALALSGNHHCFLVEGDAALALTGNLEDLKAQGSGRVHIKGTVTRACAAGDAEVEIDGKLLEPPKAYGYAIIKVNGQTVAQGSMYNQH